MNGGVGAEFDRSSPEYQWASSIINAVHQRLGLRSRWNGRICEELDPDTAGAACDNGTMTLSKEEVLEPARTAYTTESPDIDVIRLARDATATVAHEAVHLCTHAGNPNAAGAHPARDAAATALDEGLVEAWTHAHLDNILYDIRADEVVPGVMDAKTEDAYPAYSGARNGFIDGLATISGRRRAELANQLMRTDISQRWNVIADIAIDARLGSQISGEHREQVRGRLANALRADYAQVYAVEESALLDNAAKAQRGWHIGQQAAGNLSLAVDDLADEYHPAQAVERLSGPAAAHRATAAPVASSPQARPAPHNTAPGKHSETHHRGPAGRGDG